MVEWSWPSPAAQLCSILCAGTFGQPAASLRCPEHPNPLGQTSSKLQKVLPWGSPGRGARLWVPSQAAMPCCVWSTVWVEQWQLPASPFTLALLQRGVMSFSLRSLELELWERCSLTTGFKPAVSSFGWASVFPSTGSYRSCPVTLCRLWN